LFSQIKHRIGTKDQRDFTGASAILLPAFVVDRFTVNLQLSILNIQQPDFRDAIFYI